MVCGSAIWISESSSRLAIGRGPLKASQVVIDGRGVVKLVAFFELFIDKSVDDSSHEPA